MKQGVFPFKIAYALGLTALNKEAMPSSVIAEKVGVPTGRVEEWEAKYANRYDTFYQSVANNLLERVDKSSKTQDTWELTGILPNLNRRIFNLVTRRIGERIYAGRLELLSFFGKLDQQIRVTDEATLRVFQAERDNLFSTKLYIRDQISEIAKKARQGKDTKEAERAVTKTVFNALDLLAGGGERYGDSKALLKERS
jgi:uncharacterized protein YdcH (DUF465 family)